MIGVRYAQNHSWIFSSLSTPILIFLQFCIKDFINLRQTVRFHGILSICSPFITNLVIFVLGRSQIWYRKKNVPLTIFVKSFMLDV